MSVFKILLYAFLIYLGYKIIFQFIVPVYRTTRQVKKQFREMNERMNEYVKQQGEQSAPEKEPQIAKEKPGDYIEFEEIK